MVEYMVLANRTLIIKLSTQVLTITPYMFNYHKLLLALPTATEDIILSLAEQPETPEGIWYGYTFKADLALINIDQGKMYLKGAYSDMHILPDETDNQMLFKGIFVSIDDAIESLPEYFI